MLLVLIDLLPLSLAALLGATGTWWLLGRKQVSPGMPQANAQSQRAAEVLARLHDLATRVAIEVDEHNGRVEEINEELTSTKNAEATSIVRVVAKLVQANEKMQKKLATAEDKLREQAQELETHVVESLTDALTMLANRRAFDEEMARRFAEFRRQGRTFSLAMLDLDRFKQFNDTYGHQAGDEVLRGVGRALRRRIREIDVVARYGGEEFAMIFPGTSLEEARQAANRAREFIEKARSHFDGQELRVTASFGVAEIVVGEDAAGVVQRADVALYASKNAGRNCVHWHDGNEIHRLAPDVKPDPDKDTSPDAHDQPAIPLEGDRDPLSSTVSALSLSLPTRTTFCQQVRARLAEWKRVGHRFSVLLMELDQYSRIIGQAGALPRNLGLQALTRFAEAAVREMDSPFLYNPGCLAILLPQAELAGAIQAAERLRQTASTCSVPLGDQPMRLTVSIGVVEVKEGDDMISLLTRAEAALDAASRRGGDCTYQHDGDRCAPTSTVLEAMNCPA